MARVLEHRCHAITWEGKTPASVISQGAAIQNRLSYPSGNSPLPGLPHTTPAAGSLCRVTAPRRGTPAALHSNPHGSTVSVRGSSGRWAGWRRRQKPPRGFAEPRAAPRSPSCAGRRLRASTWRRRPGRGSRPPARPGHPGGACAPPAAPSRQGAPAAAGPARWASPGARRARHAPRAECAASLVEAAGSAGNAVSTRAGPGRRCGPALPASPGRCHSALQQRTSSGCGLRAAPRCPPTPRGAEWPRCRRGAPSGGTAGPCSPARAAPGTQRRGSAGPSLSPGGPQDGACLRGARGCGTGVCRHVLQSPRGTNRGLQPRLKPFGGVFGDYVRSKPVMHCVGRPARLCVLALMGAFFSF